MAINSPRHEFVAVKSAPKIALVKSGNFSGPYMSRLLSKMDVNM